MVSTLSKSLYLTYSDACISQSALATDSAAATLTLSLRLRRCFSDYSAVRILLCPRLQISSCSSLSYATSDLFPFSTTRFRWLLYSRIYHLHGVLATSHRLGIVIDTDLGKLRSALREIVNPYENAIFVIGKTLAPSDEHNFISCFGFFDCEFVSQNNFIFNFDSLCSFFIIIQLLPMARKCSVCTVTILPSHGFEDVLPCYRGFTPNFLLSGPISYELLIDAAVDIVEQSNRQFHVLVIGADGHVNVGDGPWADMRKMGDLIPKRVDLSGIISSPISVPFVSFFDLDLLSAKFLNFTEIMREGPSELAKEREFSLTDLICDSDEEWIRGGADEDHPVSQYLRDISMQRVLLDDLLVAEDLASVETTYDASHAVRYEDALS
uniref:Copine C-terminal domain-containing protein n=1 Tax=Brassica campestris TaxID=3711 RepID=M4DCG7_BRACM